MKDFEDDLAKMIGNIKFQRVDSRFQRKLREDIQRIDAFPKFFVQADKTQNYYEVTKEEYDCILHENIAKTYRKSFTT